ncbi:MAG: 16S rRNA (guanine(527)-N(7))-methyltransferase RsmG [Burkholderiaceae bacterium]|nr:16S rRNA (guanine(527)-N(7))-methyltransferase RsmG [Burkholderiaceae bacterium]
MTRDDRATLRRQLSDGIRQLPFPVSEEQCEKLLDYLALLSKWNAVYNLTAVRDRSQMVTQHLLDSLVVVPAFDKVKSVLDVGSGGGLPGIVLAIVKPEMKVSLIDTVQKKTAFLTQVKAELGLANVTVHTGRVEALPLAEKFDAITSRAFASLSDFVMLSAHLLAPAGCFIALKGAIPQDEIAHLPAGWKVEEIRPLVVPGMQAERHLVFMIRSEA